MQRFSKEADGHASVQDVQHGAGQGEGGDVEL